MRYKVKNLSLAAAALSVTLLGVYFLVGYFGALPKREIIYTQQSGDVQQVSGDQSVSQIESASQQEEPQKPEDISKISNNQTSVVNQEKSATDEKKVAELPKTTTKKNSTPGKVVENLVSWGFQVSKNRNIKAIIVHTTYNALGGDQFDFDKVMQEWKDAGVSPHYAIDRDGTIHHLVSDQNIAWHAGVSSLPDGTMDVNAASIGIEIVNAKDSKFTDAQYVALNALIDGLKKKYAIKYILGHDEIAPGRKTDPWGIDWKKVNR